MSDMDDVLRRYAHHDVLAKWSTTDFDDQTRDVLRRRIEQVPAVQFFTPDEAALLDAVADRIVPQPERTAAERIPIVPFVDERLHEDRRQGYRLESMPPQREAWRLGLAGIAETARALHGGEFTTLRPAQQDDVLRRISAGDPPGEVWKRLDAGDFFTAILSHTIVKIYYAHPSAWNETGYHGPSSPRGHVRKGIGKVDPWEAHEQAPEQGVP